MPPETRRDTDVVLDPKQYAFILDATKGTVVCHVGSTRLDLADKDRPVKFEGGAFIRCDSVDAAIMPFTEANEGDYIVLENPAKGTDHPDPGKGNSAVELDVGRQIVIPGPACFPLWPGQTAKVIPGHQLRSNQYVVARVINETTARENLEKMVVKGTTESGTKSGEDGESAPPATEAPVSGDVLGLDSKTLTTGKLVVIQGTVVSFFIPPTGIEVVAEADKFVREAVTLETLEYCILVDENGNKRYERGPQVVFPRPTETFVSSKDKGKSRKFRAIELNEISGLYVKVIEAYKEGETDYEEGVELFITGKDQRIYFPRREHAIIKYGDREVHYATAIPAGEARYLLNRLTGDIKLVVGPKMCLPDPRSEVFVRKILPESIVDLWFPGNASAQEYNRRLADYREGSSDFARERVVVSGRKASFTAQAGYGAGIAAAYDPTSERAVSEFGGDEITRKNKFTPARAVTLDTRFEGAVLINVWTGFAVQVVSKTGKREVVVGPSPRLLEYDETLEAFSLSTGTPKSFHQPLRAAYLRVKNNRVSDIVRAETSDFVDVEVRLSYRVNFEGDKEKWFAVDNYVGLLCERGRSILRSRIKKASIKEFMDNSVEIVRDTLLGEKPEDGPRAGLTFDENGMRVYDVEVLNMTIGDQDIGEALVSAQHSIVQKEIDLAEKEQDLKLTKRTEEIVREIAQIEEETSRLRDEIRAAQGERMADAARAEILHEISLEAQKLELAKGDETVRDEKNARQLAREEASRNAQEARNERAAQLRMTEADRLAEVFKKKLEAISPNLIAAVQTLADSGLTQTIIEKITPLATLRGESVNETFKDLMAGTVISELLENIGKGGNGGGFGGRVRTAADRVTSKHD
jgi:major vault protein